MQRNGSGHHKSVALAFEQHPVEFLGNFRRSQREFSPRRLHEARFDEPNQTDTDEDRE